jgi:hypothetical protein
MRCNAWVRLDRAIRGARVAQTEVNAMGPAVVPVCVRVASLGAFCTMVAPPVATALAVGSLLAVVWTLRRTRS